jgi:hypothetical protein
MRRVRKIKGNKKVSLNACKKKSLSKNERLIPSGITAIYFRSLALRVLIRYLTVSVATKLEIPPAEARIIVRTRSSRWMLTSMVRAIPHKVLIFVGLSIV